MAITVSAMWIIYKPGTCQEHAKGSRSGRRNIDLCEPEPSVMIEYISGLSSSVQRQQSEDPLPPILFPSNPPNIITMLATLKVPKKLRLWVI